MRLAALVLPLAGLVACRSDSGPAELDAAPAGPDGAPTLAATLDLVRIIRTDEPMVLDVHIDQPDSAAASCDRQDFILPGEVWPVASQGWCQRETCVSELRLWRGEELVESLAVEADNYLQMVAVGFDLELEVVGCGEPVRVPLGFMPPYLPTGLSTSAKAGRLAFDLATSPETTSYLTYSWNNQRAEWRHSQPAVTRIETGVDGCPITVDLKAVQLLADVTVRDLRLRSWTVDRILDSEFCVPREVDGRWPLDLAGTSASAWLTTTLPAAEPVKTLVRPVEASLDRPDPQGLLRFAGTLEGSVDWDTFAYEQGATNDTLRLEKAGKSYAAVVAHVEPSMPINFGAFGDRTFLVAYTDLLFVNVVDGNDNFFVPSLSFDWLVAYQVANPEP